MFGIGSNKNQLSFDVTIWWYRVNVVPISPKYPLPGCSTQLTEESGIGIDFVPIPVPTPVQTSISVPAIQVLISYRTYRSVQYAIDVVPNLPEGLATVLMTYPTYRCSVDAVPNLPKWYWCRADRTEVSSIGTKVSTGTGGRGIYVVPNIPKCPVPVLMSYQTWRSVRFR